MTATPILATTTTLDSTTTGNWYVAEGDVTTLSYCGWPWYHGNFTPGQDLCRLPSLRDPLAKGGCDWTEVSI